MTIAVFDKIRRFFRAFRIDDSAEFWRFAFLRDHSAMIGDNSAYEFRRFAPCRKSSLWHNRLEIRRVRRRLKSNLKLRAYRNRRDGLRGKFRKVFPARFSALSLRLSKLSSEICSAIPKRVGEFFQYIPVRLSCDNAPRRKSNYASSRRREFRYQSSVRSRL